MTRKHIKIAIPTMVHAITLELLQLYEICRDLQEKPDFGYRFSLTTTNGIRPIPYARNKLAGEFLKDKTADMLWFWDSDVIPTPETMKLLKLIESDDCDVAAGIYPMQTFHKEPPLTYGFYDFYDDVGYFRASNFKEGKDILQCDGVTTGNMIIKRHVLVDANMRFAKNDGGVPCIFRDEYLPSGKLSWGDDLDFCRRLKKHGYKLMVDTSVQWGHIKTVDLGIVYALAKASFAQGLSVGRDDGKVKTIGPAKDVRIVT
jgi:hypothetical protein